MAALNTSAFTYALKKRYGSKKVEHLAIEAGNSPWYAMVPKMRDFGGLNYAEAVVYADVTGRSKGFSYAQANKGGAEGQQFVNTRKKDYCVLSIDTETILSSQGNENALLTAVKNEVDSGVQTLGRQMAIDLYGNGTATIGTISAISSGAITLTSKGNAKHFEKNQRLVVASSATAAPRAAVGTVTSVNRTATTAQVTVNSGVDPTDWAANDLIFVEGDYRAASDVNAVYGLSAWLPTSTAGLGTAFNGVTRSDDVDRLAGHRKDATGLRVSEAVFDLASEVAEFGGRPSMVLMSHQDYRNLMKELDSKVQYTTTKTEAGIGFSGAIVHGVGSAGSLTIYPDMLCPYGTAYVITPEVWTLKTLGAAPRFLDLDGLKANREATADAIEWRLGYFGNLCCRAPGFNGVVYNLS